MKPFFTEEADGWSLEYHPDYISIESANSKVAPLLEENERLKKQLEATIEVAQMRGAAACDGVERIAQLEKENRKCLRSLHEKSLRIDILEEALKKIAETDCGEPNKRWCCQFSHWARAALGEVSPTEPSVPSPQEKAELEKHIGTVLDYGKVSFPSPLLEEEIERLRAENEALLLAVATGQGHNYVELKKLLGEARELLIGYVDIGSQQVDDITNRIDAALGEKE